jgi:pimeloyl-ACP methyl ester carboxylesterase
MANSGYAMIHGLHMYYEIYGSGGIPLVLIHGGGSTITTSFGRILPFFTRQMKVIAVELQAHGHSGDRESEETFEQDADDVAELLKQLHVEKANFLGFSNGGSTTLQIGIRHPELVNKLISVSAVFKRDGMIPGFFDMMQNASLADMPQPLKDAYLKVAPDPGGLQTMHDKDRDRMVRFKDWPESEIRSIQAPALIVNADRDVVTKEHALILSGMIPNAELMILPGTHGSFLGEICTGSEESKMPQLFAGMVMEWLEK